MFLANCKHYTEVGHLMVPSSNTTNPPKLNNQKSTQYHQGSYYGNKSQHFTHQISEKKIKFMKNRKRKY